ncbi:MAG TPA: YkuS family protein [Firmicutes bacterium]|nr:YkuS family protein [Bacillota bacterium]
MGLKEMQKGIVAVAEGLSNIGNLLEREGYTVVGIDGNLRRADVVVVSGMDMDMSGVSAISTETPIIDATGKPPHEVLQIVEDKIRLKR